MHGHLRERHAQTERLTSFENTATGAYRFGHHPDVAIARHSDSVSIGGTVTCRICDAEWTIAPPLDPDRAEVAVMEHLAETHKDGHGLPPTLETYVDREGNLAIWITAAREDGSAVSNRQ